MFIYSYIFYVLHKVGASRQTGLYFRWQKKNKFSGLLEKKDRYIVRLLKKVITYLQH